MIFIKLESLKWLLFHSLKQNKNKGILLTGPLAVKCLPTQSHPLLLNGAGLHPLNLKEDVYQSPGMCLLAPPLMFLTPGLPLGARNTLTHHESKINAKHVRH